VSGKSLWLWCPWSSNNQPSRRFGYGSQVSDAVSSASLTCILSYITIDYERCQRPTSSLFHRASSFCLLKTLLVRIKGPGLSAGSQKCINNFCFFLSKSFNAAVIQGLTCLLDAPRCLFSCAIMKPDFPLHLASGAADSQFESWWQKMKQCCCSQFTPNTCR
jgi:hypothetical protein